MTVQQLRMRKNVCAAGVLFTSGGIVSADTQERHCLFLVATKEPRVNTSVGQLYSFPGCVFGSSSLRRKAMAAPAAVNCMPCQTVLSDLPGDCSGARRHTRRIIHSSPSFTSSCIGTQGYWIPAGTLRRQGQRHDITHLYL